MSMPKTFMILFIIVMLFLVVTSFTRELQKEFKVIIPDSFLSDLDDIDDVTQSKTCDIIGKDGQIFHIESSLSLKDLKKISKYCNKYVIIILSKRGYGGISKAEEKHLVDIKINKDETLGNYPDGFDGGEGWEVRYWWDSLRMDVVKMEIQGG